MTFGPCEFDLFDLLDCEGEGELFAERRVAAFAALLRCLNASAPPFRCCVCGAAFASRLPTTFALVRRLDGELERMALAACHECAGRDDFRAAFVASFGDEARELPIGRA